MPEVVFAPAIQRHQPCPACRVEAATVRAALDQVFAGHPALRDYIVDEQGALRRHLAIFIDGEGIRDRRRLSDAVAAGTRIYVVQALSGG